MTQIPVFDATSPSDLNRALAEIEKALDNASPVLDEPVETEPSTSDTLDVETPPDFNIPAFSQLIGIRTEVYDQIRNALKSGKRHLMFYGPPGTGKTSLAELVAGHLYNSHRMVTGSSDWSSQDIIGGYQPAGDGSIRFSKGILLEHFDKPLIIDELNRCDIDRVLGPLFTVLSGQPTTLPYLRNPADENSERFVILPAAKANAKQHEFAPTQNWRLLATLNSIDKASLYQMSYALTRRFAWILVDAPEDLNQFVRDFGALKGYWSEEPPESAKSPIADIWSIVNDIRPMGAAPFIDVMAYCKAAAPDFNFFVGAEGESKSIYLSAFQVSILPMLDGVAHEQANRIAVNISNVLGLTTDSKEAKELTRKLLSLAL
ncbi:AAA family ATPase [[Pseudomonas] carboxydohydrogena]|uniref:AAA family ATPase n=1 Tax=Afipia carboxydohydrogena TaxID=290 RepID=A0ABY8BMD8_AFICR|nr:AAA family ATPase [[Pseudomonas] carboxydohydrogena]WEF51118.1 AAA family ATPase [[Pseudomonas] carboxydohydrogena]